MYDNKVSDEDDYPSNADVVTEFERARRGVRALIGAPVPAYRCSLDDECTETLTCKGLHTEVTICTGTETCEDPSHE